jgi:hypothetical protein
MRTADIAKLIGRERVVCPPTRVHMLAERRLAVIVHVGVVVRGAKRVEVRYKNGRTDYVPPSHVHDISASRHAAELAKAHERAGGAARRQAERDRLIAATVERWKSLGIRTSPHAYSYVSGACFHLTVDEAAALADRLAEADVHRHHSETLNDACWRLAQSLGLVPDGADRTIADPEQIVAAAVEVIRRG